MNDFFCCRNCLPFPQHRFKTDNLLNLLQKLAFKKTLKNYEIWNDALPYCP